MGTITDGYYFMFEIGWFLDLLIPTLVRIKNGKLYLVGSTPCDCKNMKPCCIPAGGATECKGLELDDPALKAFRSTDSLVPLTDLDAIEQQLERNLDNQDIQSRYLNSKAKRQREATIERVMSDFRVLSALV